MIDMSIIVIGVGQSLRGDDAAGLEAVEYWQEKHPRSASRSEVSIRLIELPGVGLLEMLEGMDAAVIVDAVRSSSPPGRVRTLAIESLEAFPSSSGSAHGWGVAETLRLGIGLYPHLAKCQIILIGIEAGRLELGPGLSPEVAAAIPEAGELIEKNVQKFL